MATFELPILPALERYTLLTGLIVPRPIGWIGTFDQDGGCNLTEAATARDESAEAMLVSTGADPVPTIGEPVDEALAAQRTETDVATIAVDPPTGTYRAALVRPFKVRDWWFQTRNRTNTSQACLTDETTTTLAESDATIP